MRSLASAAKLFSSCSIAASIASSLVGCAPSAPPPSYPAPPPAMGGPLAPAMPAGDPHITGVEQRSRLRQRMSELRVPGVSVAVIDHGVVVWARGYGVADITTGAPVTPDTLFQAASVSKPVAALAVMRLVQEGLVGLDDDVNQRLRSWHLRATPEANGAPATVRELLSHRAGVTVHGFRGYAPGEAVPSLLEILDGRPPANSAPILVDQIPGTKDRYSGGGYTVLQAMMIDVTNTPFDALMQRAVLGPLGMTRSSFTQPLPPAAVPFAATGHHKNGAPISGRFFTYPEEAAAGLWTTPSDLARVLLELQSAVAGRGRVLSPAVANVMVPHQRGGRSLGFALHGADDRARFSKGGSNQGFCAHIEAVLATGQGAVVMTNGDAGGRIDAEVAQAVAAEYGWPELNEAPIASIEDDEDGDDGEDTRRASITAGSADLAERVGAEDAR